jgi:tetratricopeptide (TPR) repeat protein
VKTGSCCVAVFFLLISCGGHDAFEHLEKGNSYADEGKYQEASIHYRNSIQKDPTLAEAHYRLGVVEGKLGKLIEAEVALREALSLAPDHVEANSKLADLYLSAYVTQPGSRRFVTEQLEVISERLLAKDPNSYEGFRIRGYLAMAKRKPEEAVALLRRAVETGSSTPETIVALAQSLFQANQTAEAEKLSLDLLARKKDFAPAYDSLYVQYVTSRRLREAEEILRRKIANFPENPDYVVQLATFLDRYKDSSTEVEEVLRVLMSDRTKFPGGPLLVADFYERRGRADKAIAALEEGLQRGRTERHEYWKRLASIHLRQGNTHAAHAVIRDLIEATPGDDEVVAMRAALRLELGSPAEARAAISELSELVRKKPGNPDVRLFLGNALRAQGDLDAARSHYIEAAQRRPGWTPPRHALVELNLARRQYMEALRYANEIAEYQSLPPRTRLLRSVAMIGAGQVQNARVELEKLVREFPEMLEPQLELGFLDVAGKRYREAEERFRRLHRPGQKDLRALAALVEVRLAGRQTNQAIQLLEKELPRSQNPVGVAKLLASTEARIGLLDNAIRRYRTLLADNGASFDVLFELGELHRRKNDYEQAIECFQKARDWAPNDPRPLVWMGYSYEQLGRVEEAKRSYRLSLELNPENPLALNNLANLLSETGNPDEALPLVRLALKRAPEHPEFLDTLGAIYLRKKQPDSAVEVFQGLVAKHPREWRFRYQLARALLDKGEKERAKAELETALAATTSEDLTDKIRKLLSTIGRTG